MAFISARPRAINPDHYVLEVEHVRRNSEGQQTHCHWIGVTIAAAFVVSDDVGSPPLSRYFPELARARRKATQLRRKLEKQGWELVLQRGGRPRRTPLREAEGRAIGQMRKIRRPKQWPRFELF